MKIWHIDTFVSGISNTQAKERITADKWQPQTNAPEVNFRKLAAYSLAAIIPVAFFTNLGQPERVQTDKWLNPQPVPIRQVQTIQSQSLAFVPVVSQTETITTDKWYQQTQNPVSRGIGITHTIPAIPPQDPTSMRANQVWVDKLQTTNQFLFFPDVKRWQYLYPSFTNSAQALTVPERITPDKWQPETNKPLFDVKRQQYTFPSFFTDVKLLTQKETVSFDRWNYQQSLPRWDIQKNQFTYPFLTFNPLAIGTPATFISAAVQPQSQPIFDIKRQQNTYQTYLFSPYPVVNAETIRPDKWFNNPSLLRPAQSYSYLFNSPIIATVLTTSPAITKNYYTGGLANAKRISRGIGF